MTFDKASYQREYMRQRRAAKSNTAPTATTIPVRSNKKVLDPSDDRTEEIMEVCGRYEAEELRDALALYEECGRRPRAKLDHALELLDQYERDQAKPPERPRGPSCTNCGKRPTLVHYCATCSDQSP